jgi:hypothetical protein
MFWVRGSGVFFALLVSCFIPAISSPKPAFADGQHTPICTRAVCCTDNDSRLTIWNGLVDSQEWQILRPILGDYCMPRTCFHKPFTASFNAYSSGISTSFSDLSAP